MNKTAFITGGSRRIGGYLSLKLSQQGYQIVLHYNHSIDEAKALQEKIMSAGGTCHLIKADLSKPKEMNALAQTVMRKVGPIDLLIHNAASFIFDSLDSLSVDQLDYQMNIIFKSTLFLSKTLYSNLKKGHVINIIDSMSLQSSSKQMVSYWLSKKSCENLTKIMALSLAPYVRVNAIAPGFILQPVHGDHSEEESKQKIQSTPLKRMGCPKDILHAITSLENMTFTTGQVLYIDGGIHLQNHQ